jgi:hypothetical protein
MSDQPLSSAPALTGRSQRRLNRRQDEAHGTGAEFPPDDQLIPVTPADRFKPNHLSMSNRDRLTWPFSRRFRVEVSTSEELKHKVDTAIRDAGFQVSTDDRLTWGFSDSPSGHNLGGAILAERNLMEAPVATRRKNRPRWVGLGVGVVMMVAALASIPFVVIGSPLHALLFVVGFVLTIMCAIQVVNRDYWSDVVVVRWSAHATSPPSKPPIFLSPPVEIIISVGRGLSQEFRAKAMAGRAILRLYQTDRLTNLEETIGFAVGGKTLSEPSA